MSDSQLRISLHETLSFVVLTRHMHSFIGRGAPRVLITRLALLILTNRNKQHEARPPEAAV